MILERLILKNFLIHQETEVDFSEKGITAFIGDNGAGKSSIIEGINFALFGKSDKGKIAELVRWGTKKAVVELFFKVGENSYRITRTIELIGKRANQTGYVSVKKDGRYILFIQKNINREIPKITGITGRVFSRSVLVKQGDIEGIINLKGKDRAKVFEEILDMSVYQILSEEYGQRRRQIHVEVETLKANVPNIDELEEEIKNLRKNEESVKNEEKSIDEKIKHTKEEIKRIERRIEELQKEVIKNKQLRERINSIDEKLSILQKHIEEKTDRLKKIEEAEEKAEKIKPYIKELRQKEEQIEKLQKLESLKEKEKNLKEKLSEVQKYKYTLDKYEKIYVEFLEKEKEQKETTDRISTLEKLSGELSAIEKNIERLKDKLSDTKTKAISIAKQLQNFKQKYKTLELNPLLIKEFLQQNKEDLEELEKHLEKIRTELAEVEARGKELKKKKKEIEKLEGKCPTCERPLEKHTKEEILNEIEAELEELREEYKRLNSNLKETKEKIKAEKNIRELLQEFEIQFEQHKEAEKEISKLKGNLILLKRKTSELEKEKEKLKEIRDYLNKNREKYEAYIQAKRTLSQIKVDDLTKNLEQLEEKIRELTESISVHDIEDLKKEINNLKKIEKEYYKLEQLISEKNKIEEEISTYKESFDNLKEERERIKSQLKNMESLEKEIEKEKEKLKSKKDTIESYIEALNFISSRLAEIRTLIKEKEKELKIGKEKIDKIKKLEEKLEKYKKLETALGKDGIQMILRGKVLSDLPVVMNNVFSKFDFPFKQIKLTEDFDIYLLAPTFEREDRYVNISSISGGQRVALGIALRIAIGNLLAKKTGFMILDEPTIHLDEQRREDLINMLIELKEKDYIKQLIIVTHDRELEDVADAIYYVSNGKVQTID